MCSASYALHIVRTPHDIDEMLYSTKCIYIKRSPYNVQRIRCRDSGFLLLTVTDNTSTVCIA